MKIIAPLACLSLLLALIFLRSTNEPQPAKDKHHYSSANNNVSSNATGLTTISQQKPNTGAVSAQSPGNYNVSDEVVLNTVNESITRLKNPLGELFNNWGLDEVALNDVLDALHEKMIAQLRERLSDSPAITQKMNSKESSQISAEAEAKIVRIIGGTDRWQEMNMVITKSNMAQHEVGATKRKEHDQWLAARLTTEIDALKKKYGTGYEQEFRKKYGEQTADALLKLHQR